MPVTLAANAPLAVEALTSDAAFRSIAIEWNALVATMPSRTVFLRHEWFVAAWAWKQREADLHILIARAGGRIAGVLPLVRMHPPASNRLAMLAIPDTQFCDMICAPVDAASVADAFAGALRDLRAWRTLELDYLDPAGPSVTTLRAALVRQGFRLADDAHGRNLFVDLTGGWSDYYATRSRSFKKKLNLAANRLEKHGKVDIEWFAPGDRDVVRCADWLDQVIAVSAKSWKRSTGNALDAPGPQAFIRALTDSARTQGWLSMWLLRMDGTPLAMEYQLIHEGRVHALRADMIESADALSPGSHLFRRLLESLFDRGLARYYMGPGENVYKTRWTETGEEVARIGVYNATPAGRLAWFADARIKPALRRVRDRVKGRGSAPASAIAGNGVEADARRPA